MPDLTVETPKGPTVTEEPDPEFFIGHLEFEYWAENTVTYDNLLYGALGGFLVFGLAICCCLNFMFKNGVSE